MDTSYWIRYNPKITVEHTVKKYFSQYLYRLCVYAPGARSINSKRSIRDDIDVRNYLSENIGIWTSGSIYGKAIDPLKDVDFDFLEILQQIKQQDKSLNIKFRIEEPRLQIYAESEDTLKHIVDTYLLNNLLYLESITGPQDIAAINILNAGGIIRKTDLGYQYKVLLHDGRYSVETKTSILNYLNNLGIDTVRIPAGPKRGLSSTNGFLWNCYYYTNDLGINSFIHLIAPGAISNYHELVVMPNK
jgi:hypothetical protein